MVLKAEAHAQGTNRRAVVTNRPGAPLMPEGVYEAYADRGESENRNKSQIRRGGELKVGMRVDRLSDHCFMANFFRLYLHTAASNLLAGLQRAVSQDLSPAALVVDDPLPTEALPETSRKRFFNRRRRADPLDQGEPCTWRTRLIKWHIRRRGVAAEVMVSARRMLVRLSASWPYLDHFAEVSARVLAMPPTRG